MRTGEGTAATTMEIETQQRACEGGHLVQSASESSRKLDYEAEARLVAEARAAWDRRANGEVEDDEEDDPEMLLDYHAYQARKFRETWNCLYFGYFGSFEDTTKIGPMRFTDNAPQRRYAAHPCDTLQIFSVKVAGRRRTGSLQWPLHVFGKIALRDSVDHNRNMIFNRTRDNCQILTQEAPNLKLTGPTRAVLLTDPVTFEADLKVKGCTESEDQDLSYLAVPFSNVIPLDSCPCKTGYSSKLSTLWFAVGVIVYSLEATISVRVSGGSWQDGFRAQIAAHTVSIGSKELILLDSGDDNVPVACDGAITLSRQVASVEVNGELVVSVRAWQGDEMVVHRERGFKPQKAGRSSGALDIGFCQMDVSVAWSLVSSSRGD